jgi:hypothetical protein
MPGMSLRGMAALVDRWHGLILALGAPFLLFLAANARLTARKRPGLGRPDARRRPIPLAGGL